MPKKTEVLHTPEFRVSYPNVFKARMNDLSGKEQYSICCLFPKGADLSKLAAAAKACIAEKWGTKPPKNFHNPFRDQGERADAETGALPDGLVKGAKFLNMTSTKRPGVIDQAKNPIEDAERFYAGCWARATTNVYAWEVKGKTGGVMKAGISFGLRNLQLVRDDEPFSGRRKAEEEFEAIEGSDDALVETTPDDANSLI